MHLGLIVLGTGAASMLKDRYIGMILASPDFGAGGALLLLLAIAWVIIGAFSMSCFLLGLKWSETETPKARKFKKFLLLLSVGIPLGCYFAPRLVFRCVHGRYPLWRHPSSDTQDRVTAGMSKADVASLLGDPHEERSGPQDRWIYYIDSLGSISYVVYFDGEGLVTGAY